MEQSCTVARYYSRQPTNFVASQCKLYGETVFGCAQILLGRRCRSCCLANAAGRGWTSCKKMSGHRLSFLSACKCFSLRHLHGSQSRSCTEIKYRGLPSGLADVLQAVEIPSSHANSATGNIDFLALMQTCSL